jgi:hypothetical protein
MRCVFGGRKSRAVFSDERVVITARGGHRLSIRFAQVRDVVVGDDGSVDFLLHNVRVVLDGEVAARFLACLP